ncbi:MAG: DUF1638 domain-containing protein [Deltaproteobacteria bacterium]|jgi:hypothetical protein|nr:DUF1638 domain-containing protein [Deltaproteobacteria bacterium]
METILVACETIEDEITRVLKENSLSYPVIWLEGGLHNNPDNLRARMVEVFEQADGRCEKLLVSLGYCGGGVSELKTGNYLTVLPLVDDCISLLLGSMKARSEASKTATYFLTDGWMRHENNVIRSYQKTIERYGEKRADRINKLMLKNYKRFGMVKTGCYDLDKAAEAVKPLAEKMGMSIEAIPSDRTWLELLVTGPHDDPELFLTLPPNSPLDFDDWCALLMGHSSAAAEAGLVADQLSEADLLKREP